MTFDLSNGYGDSVATNRYQLPAGGYVCKIFRSIGTKSKQGRPMIVLHLDIAEGKFAGYFARQTDWLRQKYNPATDWAFNGKRYQVIFDKTGQKPEWGLVQTLEAVRKSNPDFAFDSKAFDPETLTGKLIGMVFGVVSYPRRNGSIGTNTAPIRAYSIDDIRAGNFEVPTPSTIPENKPTNFAFGGQPVDDEDVPF